MDFNVAHTSKKASSLATNFEFECRQHMASNDFHFEESLVIDGTIKRVSTDANKSKKDEWYIGYHGFNDKNEPSYTVVYGSYTTGNKFKFCSWGDGNGQLSKEELALRHRDIVLRREMAEQQRNKIYEQKAVEVQKVWQAASIKPPSDNYLSYCIKKHIEPIGARFTLYNNHHSIIIPLYNAKKQLRSLQYIFQDEDGTFKKRFHSGAEAQGAFFVLCSKPLDSYDHVYITEGWATSVSIYMALGKTSPIVFALGAYSLYKATESIRNAYPLINIILCADNDKSGVGEREAKRTALAFGGTVIVPEGHNDFNDVHIAQGLEEVKKQLQNRVIKEKENMEQSPNEIRVSFDTLPEELRLYLESLIEATDAHPMMLLSSVMTMISGYIGSKAYLPKGVFFQDLYTNLWIVCISESGSFKTTALNMGSAIARRDSYEIKKDTIATLGSMRSRGASEDDIKKKMIELKREDILLPNRTTMEALFEHLEENPSGVMYFSEFGAFLKTMSKNYNSDTMGTLTDLYDVPNSYTIRTISKKERTIFSPTISICGVSTMEWLKESFKDSDLDGGFLIRFLFFMIPPSTKLPPALPTAKSLDFDKAQDRFDNHIKRILLSINNGIALNLTQDARKLYCKYYESISKESSKLGSPLFESFARRWSPEILKLAIIMQLIENPESKEIEAGAILSGYTIVREAMKSTEILVNKELLSSKYEQDASKLLKWITMRTKERKQPVKRKDIHQSRKFKIPDNYKSPGEYYRLILETLVEEGRLECKQNKTRNEDDFFLVNP